MSCDVSLLSPSSYTDNTVGCFNYSPSVGESKPLQTHTLITPLFSFSAGHSLSAKYHFPMLSAHYRIKNVDVLLGGVGGGADWHFGFLRLARGPDRVSSQHFLMHLLSSSQKTLPRVATRQIASQTDYVSLCRNNHYF